MSRIHAGMVAALVALMAIGCGGASEGSETSATTEQSAGGEATTETTAQVVSPGEATIGDTTRCPVSGETFVVTADSPHVEYEGRTYYFCCPGCIERFQADPAAFLSGGSES